MTLLWAILACGEATAPALVESKEGCAALPHTELQVPCWITQAEQAAENGDVVLADEACRQVPTGRWAEECAFRVGEELARAGRVVEGVAFCARAQQYARYCLTHVAWRLTPDPQWDPSNPATSDLPGILVGQAGSALSGLPDSLRQEGLADLRAGLWYRMYYGHGNADPAAARAATGEDGPPARGAWALEAMRLLAPWDAPLPADLWDQLHAAWEGSAEVPRGEPLPRERRVGRYSPGVPPAELGSVRGQPTFGGGVRLVAADPVTDLRVAAIDAFFFRETTPAEAFLAWLEDPAPEVRWMAAWRYVATRRPNPGEVMPFAGHADPVVRALAAPPKDVRGD